MKTILITGGTSRVGQVLVREFLQAQHRVVFTTRSAPKAKKLLASLKTDLGPVPCHSIVTDLGQPQALLQKLRQFAPIHSFIHCARDAGNLQLSRDGHVRDDQWDKEFHLAVKAPYEIVFHLSQKAFSLESVVLIGSIYGTVVPNLNLYKDPIRDSAVHYGVCKAALIHLGKELAVRLASKKIRVNTVSFGGIRGRVTPSFEKRYSQWTPQNRMLSDEDLFAAVRFLVEPGSQAVTGQNILVDGGWTLW